MSALAVSDGWIVYRAQSGPERETLTAVSLLPPARTLQLAGARLAGEIGRPALYGSNVVFTASSPQRSAVELVNLATGERRTLRASERGAALLNPSLLNGRVLYERVDRCAQQLRIGSPRTRRGERVLLSIASTVTRDPGYQRGYEHAYNSASLCRNRGSGAGAETRLGPTALSFTSAFVTEIHSNGSHARIITVSR